MSRKSVQYICQQCGYKSSSFYGKCPECNSWNSLVETMISLGDRKGKRSGDRKEIREAENLSKVKTASFRRISSGITELDGVLGGTNGEKGFVPGSLVLLAGDPGIGKSTLTLQLISTIGGLYVSGEESSQQVKLRAERLKVNTDKVFILPETNLENIEDAAGKLLGKMKIMVIDSIQTLWTEELTGAAGAIGQVRECTLRLLNLAKKNGLTILLIGHVTKEGSIAGPKVLEHIVDTVLYLEGERFQSLRLLRTTKNRYGPVDEVGVFSMEDKGLVEVKNPSQIFLGEGSTGAGSAIVATLEGSRPILVEVQALTVLSQLPLPRRVGSGVNNNRLQMLIAILQKHARLPLGKFDIFVNVASGIKLLEPAADLGICLAIASSVKNKPVPRKTVAIGEVGLLGEIRNVIGLERRIKEAKKMGFENIITPKNYTYLTKAVGDIF